MVLDCRSCDGMDSTFLGTLVGLATDLQASGGQLQVMQLSDRLLKTFRTLGVDRVVEFPHPGDGLADFDDDITPRPLDVASGMEPDILNRTMIQAHETLSSLSDGNRAVFEDVLIYLRRESRDACGD